MKLFYTLYKDGDGYSQLEYVSTDIKELKKIVDSKDQPIFYTEDKVLMVGEYGSDICYEGKIAGRNYRCNGEIYESEDDIDDDFAIIEESIDYYKNGKLVKRKWNEIEE